MKLTVTKCFDICYGHQLPGHDGACKNWHGHNSRIEVTFRKLTEEERLNCKELIAEVYPSMVVDFKDIKKHVKPIVMELDHRNLNEVFQTEGSSLELNAPTAENIASFLWEEIREIPKIDVPAVLTKLRVSETPDSWAEITED